MSKILGVDFGDRRTGVAISDDSRVIAFPRETLSCPRVEQAAAAVARLAEAERVAEIVVGYPLNMNSTQGPRTARTDEFLAELAKRTRIPLRKWDERLSTKIAEAVLIEAGTSRGKRRGVVDKLAAQVILQGYLDATGGLPSDGEDLP
ncbi:MAG TPA: Holliday junction resolvase RuvX [Verrucomicrobia bacterium]|nr:Holliday junction resolvase RuvX [Verrucomicrobiota bacterium]